MILINQLNIQHIVKTNYLLITFTLLTLLLSCSSEATSDPSSTPSTTPQVSKYTVTFDSQGGSDVTSQTVTSNSVAKQPLIPTLTDRGFGGWYTDEAFNSKFYFTNKITSNITLYAKWGIPITITFDGKDGSAISDQVIAQGSTAQKLTPTRNNYRFDGWYTNETFTSQFYFTNKITSDTTLYAKWTRLFTLTFDSRSGSSITNQTIASNSLAFKPTPTRKDYAFDDWYTNSSTSTPFSFTTPIRSDITLYAKWNIIVTFDSEGGSPVSSKTNAPNTPVKKPSPPPTKASASFVAWYTTPHTENDSVPFNFNTLITTPITLYARWAFEIKGKYTIIFDSIGGSPIQPQYPLISPETPTETLRVIEPNPPPTKTGSTFAGWYTDPGFIKKFIFTNQITHNLTLYAKWSTTLSFNSQGGSPVQSLPIVEGSKAIEPISPTYSGKAFDGWHTDSTLATPFDFNTPITNATTLYAKWGPPVTVTFNSQSGSAIQPQIIVSNSKAREPTPPTYNTYGFGGWYTDSTTVNPFDFNTRLSNDITLYAKWGIPIVITFNHLDGITTNKVIVASGEKTAEPMPTRSIYVLLGWYTDVAFSSRFDFTTPITSAITLYAKWEAQPTTKTELITLINQAISDKGDNIDLNFIKTSHITDMSDLFKDKTTFNGKVDNWDTSSVTSMENMFYKARKFNQSISNWNTSKVTNMSAMFFQANRFNQNISNWNVTNVVSMKDMFQEAILFNQNIGSWNTSKVTDMSGMFYEANKFNQNIGGWNVTNVTTMRAMFRAARGFNQNIGSWNTSKVTDMYRMFQEAAVFNQDISNWNVSNVTTMFAIFFDAKKFNQNLEKWTVHPSLNKNHMFTGSPLQNSPPSWYSD